MRNTGFKSSFSWKVLDKLLIEKKWKLLLNCFKLRKFLPDKLIKNFYIDTTSILSVGIVLEAVQRFVIIRISLLDNLVFRLFVVLCGYHHKNQRGLEVKIILPIENDEEPKIVRPQLMKKEIGFKL